MVKVHNKEHVVTMHNKEHVVTTIKCEPEIQIVECDPPPPSSAGVTGVKKVNFHRVSEKNSKCNYIMMTCAYFIYW